MAKLTVEPIPAESRILEAAHKVFLVKGFSAATVRDVAKEANTNVASVSYYFGSKEKLFDEVMLQKIQRLVGVIIPIVTNEKTTLNLKIDRIVESYIDFLIKNPDLPTFIVGEFRKKNVDIISRARVPKDILAQSHFVKQLRAVSGKVNPLQLLVSLAGMTIFPFIVKPLLVQSGMVNERAFLKLVKERKQLVTIWMKAIVKAK